MLFQLLTSLVSLPFSNKPSGRDIFDESQYTYRVWPHLCDFNLHLNNAKYLGVMEHSRWRIFRQRGWFNIFFHKRLSPVIASCEISYVRELSILSQFTSTTKILGWDEKYFYVEHAFIKGNVVCCHALLKVAFVNKGRLVSARDVCNMLGVSFDASSDLTSIIKPWKLLSDAKRAQSEHA